MRTRLLVVMLGVLYLLSIVSVEAIDPPKKLQWDMAYDELKEILENPPKSDPVKVKKLSKNHKTRIFYPEHHLPEGFRWCSLEKIKLLDKKVSDAIAVFNKEGGLTNLQYQFRIITGDDSEPQKMWSYYQKLSDALKKKYGQPSRDQVTPVDFGTDIPEGTYLETVWTDEKDGSQVRVLVTLFKLGRGFLSAHFYYVILEYSNKDWLDLFIQKALDEDL